MLTGIDVHDGQGAIEWHRVAAAGHTFAYLRAAYGDRADKMVAQNYAGAKAAGLKVGLYHFFRATRPADDQAALMAKLVGDLHVGAGDLPPALDVEDNPHYDGEWDTANNGPYISGLRTWIAKVSASIGKQAPVIYTRASFWKLLGAPDGFAENPLWVAHYTTAPQPRIPSGWARYLFWQNSESGHVDGVSGACDMNVFAGTETDLSAALLH